jgi:hypothetical protein
MSDIFKEVDEEVRRDQALAFWTKYQNQFLALALVIVAASGGWRWYQNQQRAAAEAAGARYEAALQLSKDGKSGEADQALQDIIKQGPTGYALLARFRGAAEVAATDKPKAVSIYESLANDNAVDSAMRDIARLRAALLRLDEADAAEIRSRLEPLAAPGAPFRNSARELLAFSALKANDLNSAAKWLDAIVVDSQAPQSIRQRAEALIGLVTGAK